MSGKAAKVVISERQQETLRGIVAQRSAAQHLVQRARIVLMAFAGLENRVIAEEVGLGPDQVGVWRKRWQAAWERLIWIECAEGAKALRVAIDDLFADLPRSGSPGKFTPEQVAQIIAVACELPEESDRPVTHWTPRELADEVVKRGIVDSISVRQVGRFLKSSGAEAAPDAVLAEHHRGRSGEVRTRGGRRLPSLSRRASPPSRREHAHSLG
jgi:putative transposase